MRSRPRRACAAGQDTRPVDVIVAPSGNGTIAPVASRWTRVPSARSAAVLSNRSAWVGASDGGMQCLHIPAAMARRSSAVLIPVKARTTATSVTPWLTTPPNCAVHEQPARPQGDGIQTSSPCSTRRPAGDAPAATSA
jgi:hypothetical protein